VVAEGGGHLWVEEEGKKWKKRMGGSGEEKE
jgi:hypothetical protein